MSNASNIGGAAASNNLNEQYNAGEAKSSDDILLKKNIEQINSGVNGQEKVPLDTLMMAIMFSRAELLESQIRDQVELVREKNTTLKEANNIMAKARSAKADSSEDDESSVPDEVNQFLLDNDIPWGDDDDSGKTLSDMPSKLDSTGWDLLVENLKGWTESLTSTSQLEMTKLQSLSGKFNQTFEMVSQYISKYYRGGDNIISKI